jgi:exoribonuclease II
MTTHPYGVPKRQTLTRIPPFRPGDWVRVRDLGPDHPLSGKVRRVRSLTCSITSADQRVAVWRVHLEPDGCVEWHAVERPATEGEIARAVANGGRR